MDFRNLQSNIEEAAKLAFEKVRAEYPEQQFCGYALYSDPDAITICPAMNSRQNLERMVSNDPDDPIYYRWSPGEWDHEFEGAEFFRNISAQLESEARSIEYPEAHQKFKDAVYESCVLALENLRNQGFFCDIFNSGVLVFSISGGSNEKECDWISKLNGADISAEFVGWVGC